MVALYAVLLWEKEIEYINIGNNKLRPHSFPSINVFRPLLPLSLFAVPQSINFIELFI